MEALIKSERAASGETFRGKDLHGGHFVGGALRVAGGAARNKDSGNTAKSPLRGRFYSIRLERDHDTG